jgi:hypothetical protein
MSSEESEKQVVRDEKAATKRVQRAAQKERLLVVKAAHDAERAAAIAFTEEEAKLTFRDKLRQMLRDFFD